MKTRRTWLFPGAMGVAMLLGACATLEQLAPPVDDRIIAAAELRGDARDAATHGREVFIAECRGCHSLNTPASRTEAEWSTILPEMAKKARLTPAQAADVRVYIFAARDAARAAR